MRRRRGLALPAVAASMAAALLAGCGSSSSSPPVAGRSGPIEILHPFLPDPPNPSVAAVYLTIRNTGVHSDRLLGATTPITRQTMLMAEEQHGGLDAMAPLSGLTVPARGEGMLAPGYDHLMLEDLHTVLRVGERIRVTLEFRRAGPLTVSVPVVPLQDIVGNPSGTAGMKSMKGM